MVDYESNTIKPVKSLDTIAGLAPSRPRDERKRRQHLQQEQDHDQEQKQEQEPSAEGDGILPGKQPKKDNNQDDDGIDYCA